MACPAPWLLYYTVIIVLAWLSVGQTVSASLRHLYPRLTVRGATVAELRVAERNTTDVRFVVDGIPDGLVGKLALQVSSADTLQHATVLPDSFDVFPNTTQPSNASSRRLHGQFSVEGEFIGFSSLKFVLSNGSDLELMESKPVPVTVSRGKHVLDIVFIHLVIILVLLLYVNMGATIDTQVLLSTLRRPTAPLLGVVCQYLFMPAFSYGLGYLFLSSHPSLWLGLFVTGCSPGGGGSNMWTYLLGGSLDLSVTMTFVSTVAAFVAMPCWVWALAPTIFSDGQFDRPPFRNIGTLVVSMVVSIAIGMGIRWGFPKAGKFLVRLLKPLCLFFLAFVMIFGTYAYWFIFKFLTWTVGFCAILLPLCGFLFGFALAMACKRERKEVIAISIETGVQNTGLAIGFLKVALSSFAPLGDIAMVVPIAVATCTPIPLGIYYAVSLVRGKKEKGCAESKNHVTETDCLSHSTISTLDLTM